MRINYFKPSGMLTSCLAVKLCFVFCISDKRSPPVHWRGDKWVESTENVFSVWRKRKETSEDSTIRLRTEKGRIIRPFFFSPILNWISIFGEVKVVRPIAPFSLDVSLHLTAIIHSRGNATRTDLYANEARTSSRLKERRGWGVVLDTFWSVIFARGSGSLPKQPPHLAARFPSRLSMCESLWGRAQVPRPTTP